MELYAAFLEHTDHCVGRVINAVEDLGALDDTLIYVITGDNGASGEGTLNGTWNESLTMTGMEHVETAEFLRERLDTFGTPESYPQYSLGWAHAMNTPYQWTKRVASHWGGTRNGLIVHWPRRHQGPRRAAPSVPPRDRRSADLAGGGHAAATDAGPRRRPNSRSKA